MLGYSNYISGHVQGRKIKKFMLSALTLMLAGPVSAESQRWECEPRFLTNGNLTLTETSATWNGMRVNTPMFTSGFKRVWEINESGNVEIQLDAGGTARLLYFGDEGTAKPSEMWLCEQQ